MALFVNPGKDWEKNMSEEDIAQMESQGYDVTELRAKRAKSAEEEEKERLREKEERENFKNPTNLNKLAPYLQTPRDMSTSFFKAMAGSAPWLFKDRWKRKYTEAPIVYAAVVQANTALWMPGNNDYYPAVFVFALDQKHIHDTEWLKQIAEEINEALHLGSINKDERAAVMATLLLSLIDDTKPNYNASPAVFVKDINNRAEEVLIQHNKREFFKHIVIKLPSKLEAQTKYKKALVSTIFKLMKINIRAAMNSGTDILGKFYEVFLKYGNGAKDIGIVLTPRNVTEFACDVINVTNQDLIYDPTCGTGGFLVSAFDFVRKNSTQEQIREFRKHRIFGVEQQPKIAALAIVNMIFRGDGSNNIIDNNFK